MLVIRHQYYQKIVKANLKLHTQKWYNEMHGIRKYFASIYFTEQKTIIIISDDNCSRTEQKMTSYRITIDLHEL